MRIGRIVPMIVCDTSGMLAGHSLRYFPRRLRWLWKIIKPDVLFGT